MFFLNLFRRDEGNRRPGDKDWFNGLKWAEETAKEGGDGIVSAFVDAPMPGESAVEPFDVGARDYIYHHYSLSPRLLSRRAAHTNCAKMTLGTFTMLRRKNDVQSA